MPKQENENKEPQKIANRIMRGSGATTVYLAADGQWFTKKEKAEAHSKGSEHLEGMGIQEFKLKKQ